MPAYLVRRRGIAANAKELDAALTRLRLLEERPSHRARALHSYALREVDGRFGLICLLSAADLRAVLEHSRASQLPAEEIVRIAGTRVERPFAPALVHVIRRRDAWPDAAALDAAMDAALCESEGEMSCRVSWLHSHAVVEGGGHLGTFCFYQATTPQALVEHAARARIPASEITPVLGRIVFQQDVAPDFQRPQRPPEATPA